mmetsp:Transcript_23373/g.51884  ORF Transcript_23373/g.51884 Transcript_23373/m.51884 type:complete len:216 (+) Transcript_23373:662-1309(+)
MAFWSRFACRSSLSCRRFTSARFLSCVTQSLPTSTRGCPGPSSESCAAFTACSSREISSVPSSTATSAAAMLCSCHVTTSRHRMFSSQIRNFWSCFLAASTSACPAPREMETSTIAVLRASCASLVSSAASTEGRFGTWGSGLTAIAFCGTADICDCPANLPGEAVTAEHSFVSGSARVVTGSAVCPRPAGSVVALWASKELDAVEGDIIMVDWR